MRKALTISRRDFIRSTSVAATGLTVGATEKAFSQSSDDSKQPRKPHIIFIMTGQQRFDALGGMGNPAVISPNIDRLAKNGVVFRDGVNALIWNMPRPIAPKIIGVL